VYHALNRGVKGLALFSSPGDYGAFERLLGEAKAHAAVKVFAYCLMSTHWHLIASPERDGELSRFLHWLTSTHANRWNVFHERVGTGAVYQGRFKAIPIQTDDHFLTVCRYVERNPVRANLVADAASWRWSSLWRRSHYCSDNVLDQWPILPPDGWEDAVNQPQNEREVEAIRESIVRGSPIGDSEWRQNAAKMLRLEPSLNPRGRPTKNKDTRPHF
jgi:putative transposase